MDALDTMTILFLSFMHFIFTPFPCLLCVIGDKVFISQASIFWMEPNV